MPAGHGSAEVRGRGHWDFQLHLAISQTVTIYREKSLLARLNMLKHDSDIIGTKYKQKRKNGFFVFFSTFFHHFSDVEISHCYLRICLGFGRYTHIEAIFEFLNKITGLGG